MKLLGNNGSEVSEFVRLFRLSLYAGRSIIIVLKKYIRFFPFETT